MKKGLKAAIIAAVCVVGAGSGAYCLFTPDTVNVVIAEKTDISPVLSGIGKIEGSRKVTVYSNVDGFVSERFIVAGDRVKTGDVLIGYRDDTQQKLIAAAETDVKYSKKTLDDINALRTEYQNAVNTANAQIADCEKRYSEIESQIRTLTSDNYSTEYSQAAQRNTNDTDITALELQIQDKQTELSKAELEFKEIELLGTDDTETLQTKLSSLNERIRGYQSDISALNEQIAKLQSDSLAISSEGMKPDTYSQYLSLQNDLEAVMRKWTDAKTQKETAQSMLSAYNTIGAYEQQLAQDELSLSYAENELEKSKAGTSAPVDGIITECLVDAGAYVDKGTPVAEMQSDDSYKVRMMISKYDIPSVKLGQDADINVGNKQYSGKVSKIDQTAETDISGKAKASIEILIDSDEAFIIGLDADVTIHLESAEDVLAVPTSCLYTDDEGSYVYIYENGTVEKAYVDVGKKDSKFAQVEGIGEGAHIVSEPSADNYVDQKVKEKIKKK